eukprot:TRINITY_DN2545_c0_g1_i1.p1 TRINITY_DN2545_c0_g1~~TRINITY_DN2545_c0_g1_i1.p1  ORF type:complete len:173 (+),score=78.63 TRINITY_DN2545_c0_g1_i1:98-616(+)
MSDASPRPSRNTKKPQRYGAGGGDDEGSDSPKAKSKVPRANARPVKKNTAKTTKKKAAGGRKKKDPNAPKNAKSAYIFFSTAKRPDIKNQNPDAKAKDLLKLLAAEWKKMSDEEKAPYVTMADEDKERAKKEKEAWAKKQSSKDDEEEGSEDEEDGDKSQDKDEDEDEDEDD